MRTNAVKADQDRARVATEHPDIAPTETADDVRGWIELLPD